MSSPGFSERAFEFAFNAEYCAANNAILCGMPHIPSQRKEKWLGYDVAFELAPLGGQIHLIALQHKVASYASCAAGTNANFWAQMGGTPYFRFPVEVEQFNLLEAMSSAGLPGITIRYCVPAFHTHAQLQTRYIAQTVMAGSVFINVAGCGQLAGASHNCVYQPGNPAAWVFSDPLQATLEEDVPRLPEHAVTNKTLDSCFAQILLALRRRTYREEEAATRHRIELGFARDRWRELRRDGEGQLEGKVAFLGVLLGRYFSISLMAR